MPVFSPPTRRTPQREAVAHRLSERPGEGENVASLRKGLGVNRKLSGFRNFPRLPGSGQIIAANIAKLPEALRKD